MHATWVKLSQLPLKTLRSVSLPELSTPGVHVDSESVAAVTPDSRNHLTGPMPVKTLLVHSPALYTGMSTLERSPMGSDTPLASLVSINASAAAHVDACAGKVGGGGGDGGGNWQT